MKEPCLCGMPGCRIYNNHGRQRNWTLLITYPSYPTEQVWSKLSGSPFFVNAVGKREFRSMPVCSAPKGEQERISDDHLPPVLRRRPCALSHGLLCWANGCPACLKDRNCVECCPGAVQGTVSTQYIFRHLL